MININNYENVFVTEIRKAQAAGIKVLILGAANGGVRIAKGLMYRGLDFDAFVVDRKYYDKGLKIFGKDVLCLDDIKSNDCILIRSIANYTQLDELKKNFCVIDEDVQSLSMVASDPFDKEFVQIHLNEFNSIYNKLADDKSRNVLNAYLNQKLDGRFSEMANVWDKLQYFDEKFYMLNEINNIVDCGAYTGDSFLSFCNEYRRLSGKEYTGNAYLLDPYENNQHQINENLRNSSACVKGLKIGAWFETGSLSFQTDSSYGNAGKISSTGNISIKVDTIDNIVQNDRVDFIKMDIEGAELNALRGASKTIKRDHPILAICAYHKRDDLLELPKYIQSLYKDYKFYLRAYGGPYSIELVLYAVK